MTMYAKIIDGVIVSTQEQLPVSTERVSNFYLLSEEERQAHGWFTVVEEAPPSYDPVTQHLSALSFRIDNGVPHASRSVVEKTVAAVRREMLDTAKFVAERNIQEEYSTQEQIAALANLTTAGHRTAVMNKIQTTFGAFMTFRTAVNAATTLQELKAVWDSYPQLREV